MIAPWSVRDAIGSKCGIIKDAGPRSTITPISPLPKMRARVSIEAGAIIAARKRSVAIAIHQSTCAAIICPHNKFAAARRRLFTRGSALRSHVIGKIKKRIKKIDPATVRTEAMHLATVSGSLVYGPMLNSFSLKVAMTCSPTAPMRVEEISDQERRTPSASRWTSPPNQMKSVNSKVHPINLPTNEPFVAPAEVGLIPRQ